MTENLEVLNHRMSHNIVKTDLTLEQGCKLAEMYASNVRQAIITMTGFDPAEYANKL